MHNLIKEFKKMAAMWHTNLRSELAMKQSFLMLTIGMIINDLAFPLVWIFFFMQFGDINGWNIKDIVGLQGMTALTIGLSFFTAGGANKLPQQIDTGYFDNHLLTPGNLYLKIFASHIRTSALGDVIYGTVMSVIYLVLIHADAGQILMWLLPVLPAVVIVNNFTLITGLVAFYITDASYLASSLLDTLVGPSLYPSGTYSSGLRFFFIFIVPAIVVGGLPVEIVKNYSWWLILGIWALAAVWTILANLALKAAVKKYESANLLANRV